jgi:hypothetical protein
MSEQKDFEFKNDDPIARIIRDRFRWSPRNYGILILIINIVIDFSSAAYFNAFVTRSGPPGLLQDPTILLVSYVMMPVVGGFYIWSINQIGVLVQQLREANVFTDEVQLEVLYQEFKENLMSRVPFYASLIISLIIAILLLGTNLEWYPWPQTISFLNHSDIIPVLKTPMWFITMYGVCFGLFNIASTIAALRRFFTDQSIRVSPWHPDRCGGLKGISRYSMTLGYAIAVIGLTISVHTIQEIRFGTFSSSYLTWLGLAGYVVLAPLVFFLPLGTAHRVMQQAKTAQLLTLSRQFDIQYKLITTAQSQGESEIVDSVQKIESLQTLYKITEEFIIWPFDVDNLRRFLTITLAPLLPGLITVLFEYIRIFMLD